MISAAPRRVMIAGDWHGNAKWACHVISEAATLLHGEEWPLVLQLGDFGVWPGAAGAAYADAVRDACSASGVRVRFIDGNHEDFTQLEGLRVRDRLDDGGDWFGFPMDEPLAWLPRGYRWQWHGRTWLALGGGVSLDKAVRVAGRDWWPQEEITEEQAAAVIADGPADVMLTHDCPDGVRHSFPPPPQFWDRRDLARNDAHKTRLQRVVTAVRPHWLMHGHLHRAYQRMCDLGYGPVEVTGLDCDGGDGPNYAILDIRLMQWRGEQRATS
jgi:hypothetical protein